MMGATAGALASSSLAALHAPARLATPPPEFLPPELQRLDLQRRLQRLELPWLDLLPPHAHPPAHGRALWETELIGVGAGLGGVLLAALLLGVAVLVQRRARRRLPPPLPPGSSADLQDELSSIRVVTETSPRGGSVRRSVALGDGAAPPPPTEKWSPRASLLAVGAALRMERRGSAPGVGTPRLESAGSSGCLRHSAGATSTAADAPRSDSLPKKSPRRHTLHPMLILSRVHKSSHTLRRKGSSASISSTASTPRDHDEPELPPLSAAEAPKALPALRELLDTERAYVRTLLTLQAYRDEMLPLIEEEDARKVFGNAQTILGVNERLCEALAHTIEAPPGCLGERMAEVAQIFLMMNRHVTPYPTPHISRYRWRRSSSR